MASGYHADVKNNASIIFAEGVKYLIGVRGRRRRGEGPYKVSLGGGGNRRFRNSSASSPSSAGACLESREPEEISPIISAQK